MRNAIIMLLSVGILLLTVCMTRYTMPQPSTCLLPSVDAGFVELDTVVCVNTGVLATSEDIAIGNYYQEECQPGLPVPCATVFLILFAGDRPVGKVTTNVPQVADYFMRQGYVPVPESYYTSIEL